MEDNKRIPSRDEIDRSDKWAIEDLYATDELWEADLATLEADKDALAAFEETLIRSGEDLCAYLKLSEELEVKAGKLANYCMRRADEDTRDPGCQAMVGKFMNAIVSLSAATSFDTPLIMSLSEEAMEAFYRDCPDLERFRRYLTDKRRRKAHTLSQAEEKLLAAAGEMANAPDTIYGSFADADMTFPDAVDAGGGKHPLTQGTFVSLEESPDRELRRSAYENLYDSFARYKNTAAAVLNAQNKQLKFFSDARKYASPLEASLDANNVPTAVYDNLIEAVHQNLDKMHRYVRLRKKALGVDRLHFYDIYTPLLADADKRIPYTQAKETIYDALHPLGDSYRAILKEGFENRWVDVYQNQGKRSGAYSAGAAVHPFVLMNYTGTLDSQFTLAHEMGHAIHSYLSNKHQNPLDADYVIFVAEVASTCNEALLMEYLLGKTDDKKERAYLINHLLLDANFRKEKEYKRLNEEYYGPDMVVDDRIAMEWARIPHFYYNYYVFQYATGYSAAIALSRRILREGESAVRDYLKFLSGGCSASPIDLLKAAGVDMTTAEPVNQALELFGRLLDEMEALMEA